MGNSWVCSIIHSTGDTKVCCCSFIVADNKSTSGRQLSAGFVVCFLIHSLSQVYNSETPPSIYRHNHKFLSILVSGAITNWARPSWAGGFLVKTLEKPSWKNLEKEYITYACDAARIASKTRPVRIGITISTGNNMIDKESSPNTCIQNGILISAWEITYRLGNVGCEWRLVGYHLGYALFMIPSKRGT